MNPDAKKKNMKCGGFGSSDRIFRLENDDAEKSKCMEMCLEEKNCVAMSGIWGKWCFGCKVVLTTQHNLATEAFKKGKLIFVLITIMINYTL